MTSGHVLSLIASICRHTGEATLKLLAGWLRWFWRLTVAGKAVMTGTEIVALYLVAQHLDLTPRARQELVAGGSLGLAFLLIFGVLLSSTRSG